MFGLELLLIPLVVAFSAPVVAAVSAVVAAFTSVMFSQTKF